MALFDCPSSAYLGSPLISVSRLVSVRVAFPYNFIVGGVDMLHGGRKTLDVICLRRKRKRNRTMEDIVAMGWLLLALWFVVTSILFSVFSNVNEDACVSVAGCLEKAGFVFCAGVALVCRHALSNQWPAPRPWHISALSNQWPAYVDVISRLVSSRLEPHASRYGK